MVKNENRPTFQRSMVVKQFLVVFVPILVISLGLFAFLVRFEADNQFKQLSESERYQIELIKHTAEADLDVPVMDLKVLTAHHELKQYLIAENEEKSRYLGQEFLGFAAIKQVYDQVRFLDLHGNEIVRVNCDPKEVSIVPSERLQNKASRYYFQAILAIPDDQVYISTLDLNIENQEIERRIEPTIRFGTTVVDNSGHRRGVAILNFKAQKLLETLKSHSSENDRRVWLIDPRGNSILDSENYDEYTLLFPGRDQRDFTTDHHSAWQNITSQETGQFNNDAGLFTFATIETPPGTRTRAGIASGDSNQVVQKDLDTVMWKIVSLIPPNILASLAQSIALVWLPWLAMIELALLAICWYFALSRILTRFANIQTKESAQRYQKLFEDSPSALWELDIRRLRNHFEELQSKGISDIGSYFESDPKSVWMAASCIDLVDANNAALTMYGAQSKAELLTSKSLFPAESLPCFKDTLLALAARKSCHESETVVQTLQGEKRDIILRWSMQQEQSQDSFGKIIVANLDISDRKQAERDLQEANERLASLSIRDGLTGLFNRRHMAEVLEKEFERSKRYGTALSCILLDLDFFKRVNDSLGHGFGDLVLKNFADLLRSSVRTSDFVFRYGGEEFFVLLPQTEIADAQDVAEKIRSTLEALVHDDGMRTLKTTVSLGVAECHAHGVDQWSQLTTFADKALYGAKAGGRNRVEVYSLNQADGKEATSLTAGLLEFKVNLAAALDKTKHASMETIQLLAKDANSEEFREHEWKVNRIIGLICDKLQLPPPVVETFQRASSLHNNFKIMLGSTISSSDPHLTDQDREAVEDYPYILAELTNLFDFFANERTVLLAQHEKFDGSGYPEGLQKDQIPLGARVFAIADALVAMQSDRPYRPRLSPTQIVSELVKNSGTQFDPDLVGMVLEVIDEEEILDVPATEISSAKDRISSPSNQPLGV